MTVTLVRNADWIVAWNGDLRRHENSQVATVGGARTLRRGDIGRLAAGCKADFSLVDLGHSAMQPVRDPLMSLAFSGLERPIRDVYIDGRQVSRDGKVQTIDETAVIEAINRGQRAALEKTPPADYVRRPTDEIFPLTLPMHP